MKQVQGFRRRKGVALVMALVVMAVLAVILAVVTKQIVSQRQMFDQRHRQLQADWLARAGVELAAARLLDNPAAFVEETSDLLPDSKVRIEVKKAGQDVYAVTVEAELGPKDGPLTARTGRGSFRRTGSDGAIHVESVPSPE